MDTIGQKISIPQLTPSAPIPCGSSIFGSVGLKTPTLFGNLPLMVEKVLLDSAGQDSAAVIDQIGQVGASYLIYNQFTLTANNLASNGNNTLKIRAGQDSDVVVLDTIYGSSSVGVTVSNASSSCACSSFGAPIGCGGMEIDTLALNKPTFWGGLPVVFTGVTNITTEKTSTSSAQFTIYMNNCAVDTIVNIPVGQPITVSRGGVYSYVVSVLQTSNTVGSVDSSSVVTNVQNNCPQQN
jgi:hypothetical protein